jgi:hypothetical protein
MKQWEYKSLKINTHGFAGGILDTDKFDQLLNEMGREGWEMVVAFDTNYGQGGSREVVATFKRERS